MNDFKLKKKLYILIENSSSLIILNTMKYSLHSYLFILNTVKFSFLSYLDKLYLLSLMSDYCRRMIKKPVLCIELMIY